MASIPQSLRDLSIRQINYYSEIEPGVIRAFHLHGRQTDAWYVPPSDPLLVVLVDVRKGSRTEAVTHRLVLGGMDPAACDEGRLPWG